MSERGSTWPEKSSGGAYPIVPTAVTPFSCRWSIDLAIPKSISMMRSVLPSIIRFDGLRSR